MIWKVIEIHLRRLRHNRVEWLLTFFVPIAFFTIFALIFTRGVGSTPRVKVALVNASASGSNATRQGNANSQADSTALSNSNDQSNSASKSNSTSQANPARRVLDLLVESEGLRIIRGAGDEDTVDRSTAETMVRRGTATIAVVVNGSKGDVSAELLNDASDQVASQVVSALLTRAIMMASGESRAARMEAAQRSGSTEVSAIPGMPANTNPEFANFISNIASKPQSSETQNTQLENPQPDNSDPKSSAAASFAMKPPSIQIINIIGQGKTNPVVSVYAAGIAVMFLLFGATSGGGVLLEERENQTLERLLATQMTMDHLLLGKWFYLTLLGCVQVTVMFAWAQLVFGLDLLSHFDGFAMMTLATSAAAASFGLFLATLCRTRGQLNGLSVVAVLTMSALGGSMVPRYVMSEKLQEAGLWTFNAWALDGFDKVFWRELPPSELGPQLAVLMGTAFVLLGLARLLAIRWESV